MNNQKVQNWLLLRGLVRGQGHWGQFKIKLQEQFPGDHFEYLDLPGNGSRCDELSPLKISDYVESLRANCSYIKSGKKFNIIAVSLGAMVATEWMRSYPQEITKAYLVCTSSSRHSEFYNRFRIKNLFICAPLLLAKQRPEVWEKIILKICTNSLENRALELPEMIRYTQLHPIEFQNILRQLWAASRYKFPEQVPGEVILIGSHGDQLVSPQCTLDIAKAWGLTPKMHKWAGHDIAIDDPQWLLEHLL